MLANVPQLDDGQLRALEEFVQQGGGLLIAPGNRVDAAWYNGAFFQEGRGLLPAARRRSSPAIRSRMARTVSVAAERFENPALEIFNDPTQRQPFRSGRSSLVQAEAGERRGAPWRGSTAAIPSWSKSRSAKAA